MTLIVFAVLLLFAAAGVLAQNGPNRNPCLSTVCYNGGTCTSPLDKPICQCTSGFGGDRCQNTVPVKSGQCPSGPFPGELNCTRGCDNDFDCPDTLKCCNTDCERQCTDQFIQDPCYNYCYNGGSCKVSAYGPSCDCPNRFTGDRCENSTGTCPTFQPGDVSVCGGVPCETDEPCETNQKCCNLPCGGTFCTNVVYPQTTTPLTTPPTIPPTTPPTPPPTLPCFTARCSSGFVCRNTVECHNCPLTAKCVNQTDLAADIDNTCQANGYSEAILLQSSSYSNSYSQLLCVVRPSKSTCTCPTGSFCIDVGNKKGQCCAGKY